jgi:hypothetical protein
MSDRGEWKPYAVGWWYHAEYGDIHDFGDAWFWYPDVKPPVSHGPYPTVKAAIAAVQKMTAQEVLPLDIS